MTDIEYPGVVAATRDQMLTLISLPDSDAGVWMASDPIPCTRVVGVWETSHRQYVTLAVNDVGNYQIFHTVDQINHTLVHDHATEIFGIFNLGFGKSIFCATDGWWMTLDSGTTWNQIALPSPLASVAAIATKSSTIAFLIYATDKKIYRCEHSFAEFSEPLAWEEVYDASAEVPWYPAMAGGAFAVLAGVGDKIIRTLDCADTWQTINTVDGVVKSIIASDQSNGPIFLVEIEKDGISKLYWSYDAGDSLVPGNNRILPVLAGSAVIPTGVDTKNTRFAVFGRKPSGEIELQVMTSDA